MSDVGQDAEALRILRQIAPQIANIEERMGRVEDRLTRIETTLPYLATKAEFARLEERMTTLATKEDLASKPGRAEFWGMFAALLALYAVIFASLAWLLPKATGHG